ncbi:MAG: HD domain-containing protein [Zavarzinella sp.]
MQDHILTDRFDLALLFTSRIHRKQSRKGTNVPYISHLLSVCALVLEHGGNEDQAIAALLHDAPEDQGGQGILDRIQHTFGSKIAALVAACGEPVELNGASWRERKTAFISALEYVPMDAQLVIAADKAHNLACLVDDYLQLGVSVFDRFNGGKIGTMWYYDSLVELISPKIPVPLALRLKEPLKILKSAG